MIAKAKREVLLAEKDGELMNNVRGTLRHKLYEKPMTIHHLTSYANEQDPQKKRKN